MMLGDKQKQSVGDNSTAVQATGNVYIQQGPTLSEVREIALDVFRANALELKGKAMETARARGEAITDKFLSQLQRENPEGLKQAESPDFQDALFTVQKEHAKAGDEDLGELLVDLLVDRTKQPSRNVLQLVLNEALHTAPKLTNDQVAVTSLIFFLNRVQVLANTPAHYATYLEAFVKPILGAVRVTTSTFSHLEFTGCGTMNHMGTVALDDHLSDSYSGIFNKGFPPESVPPELLPEHHLLVASCLSDPKQKQISTLNRVILEKKCKELSIAPELQSKLTTLLEGNALRGPELIAAVVKGSPFMAKVFALWSEKNLGAFNLTSVGMAIAHANLKRLVKREFAPLSIWIN